jgi:hypothetical protein
MFHLIVPPLFVIEFLHRVVDLIVEYFSDCSETIIKENCVVVYEVCTIKISELIASEVL